MNIRFFSFLAIPFIALFGSGYSLAAPTGPYILIGGGEAYIDSMKVDGATITRTDISPNQSNYAINYKSGGAFDYTARGAFGYYFNSDPENTYAFGVELGFNYFGTKKSSTNSNLVVDPAIPPYPVTTNEKASAWSADLEAVFSQDLIIPNTSAIVKLGVGYEQMTRKFDNQQTLPGQLPSSETLHNNSVGVAGGIGLQYSFTKRIAARIEVNAFKGKKHMGYVQGLVGISFAFK